MVAAFQPSDPAVVAVASRNNTVALTYARVSWLLRMLGMSDGYIAWMPWSQTWFHGAVDRRGAAAGYGGKVAEQMGPVPKSQFRSESEDHRHPVRLAVRNDPVGWKAVGRSLGRLSLCEYAVDTICILTKIWYNPGMERDALQKEADQLHAEICAALADPRRIVAIYALAEKPHTVNELAADLSITSLPPLAISKCCVSGAWCRPCGRVQAWNIASATNA